MTSGSSVVSFARAAIGSGAEPTTSISGSLESTVGDELAHERRVVDHEDTASRLQEDAPKKVMSSSTRRRDLLERRYVARVHAVRRPTSCRLRALGRGRVSVSKRTESGR